jgi:S1-C subfamily serine protease
MSGGAVVNLRGELVGVTTNGGNAEGFDAQAGYAIPIDALGRRVVETLCEGREVEYGFLGITIGGEAANIVTGTVKGTPAAGAKLVMGDQIIEVDGQPADAERGLSFALSLIPVGQPVKLKVLRNEQELELTVHVAKYPVAGQVIATNRPVPWRGLRVDFASANVLVLDDNEANLAAIDRGCVYVRDVESGSSAEAAGIKRGELLTHVDGKPVSSPAEFNRAVAGHKGPVKLTKATHQVVTVR